MGTVCWDSNLTKGISEPHIWRQSDCVSITEYYAKGAPFFEPEMYARLGDDGHTGKTVAEFPVIYYIIGKIWSVTGTQLWMFRLFNGLYCMIALILLYRTLQKITGAWFWSALGPILLLASPVYAFYGISFLTNIPAFNSILIAWYFVYRYYSEEKIRHLLLASVFFSLAGLLKISSLTSFVALLFIFVLDVFRIGNFKKQQRIFTRPVLNGIILLLPVVLNYLWYWIFVENYCNLHWARYSFTEIAPVWQAAPEMYTKTWTAWFDFTARQVYPHFVWITFIGAMLFLFTQFRKVNLFWLLMMPLTFIGHAMFAMLFFFSLDGHDYYHIDILLFFVITYAAITKYISSRETMQALKRTLRPAAVVIITWMVLSCSANIQLRFHGGYVSAGFKHFFTNDVTFDEFSKFHEADLFRTVYDTIDLELTRRGFNDTTVVIAANDVSFNTLLLKLHRPGFTGMADWQLSDWSTQWRIDRGAAIMTVEYPEKETRGIVKYMDYPLFRQGNVGVYDLRPYAADSTLKH